MPHAHDHGLSLDDAREAVRACFVPLEDTAEGTEKVSLDDALGRVLAEAVVARVNVPAFDNSAMDGYAVAWSTLDADLSGEAELDVVGEAFAGRPLDGVVPSGACVRVMTGAVIPAGCDTVVMQEDARPSSKPAAGDLGADKNTVRLGAGHRMGQHVRRVGEDVRAGDVAIAKGRGLRAVDLGVCASVGVASVRVFRRLRVAFFSTGDELRPVGTPLGPGQLWDSNRHVLRGLLAQCGVDTVDLGDVGDDVERLRSTLAEASSSVDAIVSTGGVSVGVADHVFAAASPLGSVRALEVRMKPGRHYVVGVLKNGDTHALRRHAGCAYVGLPGNPVAVAVGFLQLVRPALRAASGLDPTPTPVRIEAVARTPLRASYGRTELHRGVAWREHGEGAEQHEKWSVRSTGTQGAGVLRSMAEANCFIVLAERGEVAIGETVEVELFDQT
jgi:molybdopterin molybdotransferase